MTHSSLSRGHAILLGVLVFLGVSLGGFGLFAVGSKQWLWSKTFSLRAGFRDLRGLEPGTRVRIQGMEAGEVERVDAPEIPGGDVVVRLRLDGRLRHLVRSDASVRIVSEGMIGGKVLDILPGSPSAAPIADDAQLASLPSTELTDVLGQVKDTLDGIRQSEGTVGKLLNDPTAFTAAVKAMDQSRQTLASVQQTSDAMKRFPLVRNYVEDPLALLHRPNSERNRKWFAQTDLFEPGRSVLTAQGRQKLDEIGPWLTGLKHKNSEVVVAAFADPETSTPALAPILTRQQSETVCTYLKDQHSVQKLGWLSSRKVIPVGCGLGEGLQEGMEKLPPGRVEILVFVPQGS